MDTAVKIAVCGDSFCTASSRHRQHFSNLLADLYGHQIVNLAQGGVSMVAIGLQIEHALCLFPDVVIYKNTHADRFEVPLANKKFNPNLGWNNLLHHRPGEQSYSTPLRSSEMATMISDVVQNLLPDSDSRFKNPNVSDQQAQAMKHYWIEIYDNGLKTLTDSWIHSYWTMMIKREQAIAINLQWGDLGHELFEFSKKNPHYPEPYHTDAVTQEIVAANINTYLQTQIVDAGRFTDEMRQRRESNWQAALGG